MLGKNRDRNSTTNSSTINRKIQSRLRKSFRRTRQNLPGTPQLQASIRQASRMLRNPQKVNKRPKTQANHPRINPNNLPSP